MTTTASAPLQSVRGLAVTAGLRRLNTAGFRAVVRYVASSQQAGLIVTQAPAGGTAARGSRVRLGVSQGPSPADPVVVPAVIGQDQAAASTTLRQAGLKVVVLFRKTSNQTKDGVVIDEQPRAGSSVPRGLYGQTTGTRNGAAAGVIRFVVPAFAHVSFLAVIEDDWLVGAGNGRLFRLSNQGRPIVRLRVGNGALFCVRDSAQQVVAVCSYPVVGRSPPKLWFVDAPAPVVLPEQYPWPDQLLGSYGNYLLAHRPRARDLALIDETGALAVQLRCSRAITSIAVAEGVLVLAAGALICLEMDGLSPLTRTRIWQPPFNGENSHHSKIPPPPETR